MELKEARYILAIARHQSIGKAAAIGVVLFAVIMVITACTYKFLNSRDDENV